MASGRANGSDEDEGTASAIQHDASAIQHDASGMLASGAQDRAELEKGQITAQAYLELQVERALSPYRGVVEDALLEAMRDVLRAQLDTDPALADLAERATAIES